MKTHVLPLVLLAMLLTACPSSSQPLPPGGDAGTPSLHGVVHAPAGGNVAGTLVFACFPAGDDCDEDRSGLFEVTASGLQAPFELHELQRGTYLLFAAQDTNGNGVLGDPGDLVALYGDDGSVTPPARDLVLHLSAAGTNDPVAEPYSVTGIAVDAHGNPIANALVQVIPAVTTGLIETRTDASGRYVVQGLPNVPYYIYAFQEIPYGGQTFCWRLAQNDYSTFLPEHGIVRNFQQQLTGKIPDLTDRYFGGTLTVYKFGAYAGRGKAIEFTFTATGPRIDGSDGESFVFTATLGSPDHLHIHDIPIGPYAFTATLIGYDDSRTNLTMGTEVLETPYPRMTMDWTPVGGCYAANGINDNYVWLANPHP